MYAPIETVPFLKDEQPTTIASGHGIIVKKDWIAESKKAGRRLKESRFVNKRRVFAGWS